MSWLNVPINQRPLICRHAKGQIYLDPNAKKEVVPEPVEESALVEVNSIVGTETKTDNPVPELAPKKRGRPKKAKDDHDVPEPVEESSKVAPVETDTNIERIKVS